MKLPSYLSILIFAENGDSIKKIFLKSLINLTLINSSIDKLEEKGLIKWTKVGREVRITSISEKRDAW